MTVFLASYTSAAADDYDETRDLVVNAAGVESLIINVGAGSLDVAGVDGLDSIEVKAVIVIPDVDEFQRTSRSRSAGTIDTGCLHRRWVRLDGCCAFFG
jgi:hypothetical protein